MRCKQHYTDLSSIVGVCASCLRQRLFSLIAAQSQSQSQTPEDQIRISDTNPAFPHSVSPYITRRKSDHSVNSTASVPDHRFFSTPQVGPTSGSYNFNYNNNKKKKHHSFIRFSLSNLFISKKRNEYLDPDPRVSVSNSREIATSAMSSPSWFSNIKSGAGNRKKQPVAGGDVMRKLYCPDRGMSPARYSDCGGAEDEIYDGYSGYESSESRKQTPWRTPAYPLGRRGGVSRLNLCLSPLVRASPCRLWNQKGIPVAAVDCSDMRAPVKPHLSNTKSFCANRSRKLVNFGRFDNNR